jgi:tRNA dimethylallyltransferase
MTPIVLILGPTAGGKTQLSIDLAMSLPGGGECISADSMQVYRGMDIGTAKPSADERAGVPHHLIDLLDPSAEGFTVDAWLDRAETAIADVRARKRWPIVVGGTNLYIKALVEGLLDGPGPEPGVRAELQQRSLVDLRCELETVDPDSAARIHPNDLRRTIRALEVYRSGGVPLSTLQTQWDRGRARRDVAIIGLDYPPEAINPRINARVRLMMERGLLEEVRDIRGAGGFGRQAREALGYKQLLAALDGHCTVDEAVEQIKIHSRRFAKQQRTWLKRFRLWPRSLWIDAAALDSSSIAERARTFLSGELGAPASK